MALDRFKLPNGNEFIHLKNSRTKIQNVLILAGGEVLFLEEDSQVRLNDSFQAELQTASRGEFSELADKYGIPYTGPDLFYELNRGITAGKYPAFEAGDADVDRHIDTAKKNLRQAVNSAKNRADKKTVIDNIRNWCDQAERRVENNNRV